MIIPSRLCYLMCVSFLFIILIFDAVRTGFIAFALLKALRVEEAELFLLSLYVLWILHRLWVSF